MKWKRKLQETYFEWMKENNILPTDDVESSIAISGFILAVTKDISEWD